MRPQWGQLLRRTAIVGVSLAVIGYLLGRGFLLAHRIYGGEAYNADNERVLWQTPLMMALLGMTLTAGLELLLGVCRRPAAVKASSDPNPT
jgi:hypothetical protein